MEQLAEADPDAVRRMIAAEWLAGCGVDPCLGEIALRPHQIDAARRIRALLAEYGGALLCDEVGLGKTYAALAVARFYARPLIVAPASLRGMWEAAMKNAGIDAPFISTESLSRRAFSDHEHDIVIVDEAHHFRTPSAARYRRLTARCARSAVLLISATPLHNRPADVMALLALFLGSAGRGLSDETIARLIVRRGPRVAQTEFPGVSAAVHIGVPCDSSRLSELLALPPPVPPRDGGMAAALVTQTLVRLWTSSDAALREGLRRRLARTIAIRAALEAGHDPTRADLAAWAYGEGSLQLGFAELLAADDRPPREMLPAIAAHESALTMLLARIPKRSRPDAGRAEQLRAIRTRHSDARIIAFSQFTETVAMYYRALASTGRVAMLTARGARIASGSINRREALERFAPRAQRARPPRRAEEITLLIATDLLNEGVNLQDASVVVHLDLPWTAAALEQRVGRAARLGSINPTVFVYCFDPPAPGEELLRAESIIRAKAALADARLGPSRIPPLFAQPSRAPNSVEDSEAICRALSRWVGGGTYATAAPSYASIAAEQSGVLALLSIRGQLVLAAGRDGAISANPAAVRRIITLAYGRRSTQRAPVEATFQRLRSWIDEQLACEDAGLSRIGLSDLARRIRARLADDLVRIPHHGRMVRSARIAAVHQRLQRPFPLGVEREIDELLSSDGCDDFLAGLEEIIGAETGQQTRDTAEIRAVLILDERGHNQSV